MVLILSIENDMSTDQVIDWLIFFNKPFIRLNGQTSKLSNFKIILSNAETSFSFVRRNGDINSNDIKSLWYRKHGIEIDNNSKFFRKTNNNKKFSKFINSEKETTEVFIEAILSEKHNIGYFETRNFDKLNTLQIAKECGLQIPDTIITNKKKYLKKVQYIVKPITEAIFFKKRNKTYLSYTSLLKESALKDNFNPTLFQENINKKIEIRIFYLKKKCYSMAIFSQNDSKTEVDFRKYNFDKPNRVVPYIIPKFLEKKITMLMDKLELNTGSLDFIVDMKGNYIFLEVNPSGQFGMVSYPCNYNLEKIIAEKLTGYEN